MTEAEKRRNSKWQNNNRERARYHTGKSYTKKFIQNYATMEDIIILLNMIEERTTQLIKELEE